MRRFRVLMAVVCLAALMVSPARADGSATITGVVRGDDGAVLGDICVDVYDVVTGYYASSGYTGSTGRYVVEVEAGDYAVTFFDCAYPKRYLAEWHEDASSFETATTVPVAEAAEVTVDATLAFGGLITGTLRTEAGDPLPWACVAAYDAHSSDLISVGGSNEDGVYSVGALDTGAYKISFSDCGPPPIIAAGVRSAPSHASSEGYIPEWYDDVASFEEAAPIAVVRGATVGPLDAVLARGGAISGVVFADGEPLRDVCVEVSDDANDLVTSAWTDSDGRYVVSGLRSGEYHVHFVDCGDGIYADEWWADRPTIDEADTVTVVRPAVTAGVNATLAPRPAPDMAVQGVRVEAAPIETDLGAAVSAGTQRRIRVDVANIGQRAGRGRLDVWVTYEGDGRSRTLGVDNLALRAGSVVTRTYDWDATGSAGDVIVHARICTARYAWDEYNHENDEASARAYALAGGAGFGFAGVHDDPPPLCDEGPWSEPPTDG